MQSYQGIWPYATYNWAGIHLQTERLGERDILETGQQLLNKSRFQTGLFH